MGNEVTPQEEVSNAYELAPFETEYKVQPATPVAWSLEKYEIAQELAISGKTKTKIAKERKIPIALINKWLESAEFREYIDQVVQEQAKLIKNKRLQILMKTLAAREALAEEEGYAEFSRKDGLDIISEIRKETGDDKDKQQSNYTNLLESLIKHSIDTQPKLINMEN